MKKTVSLLLLVAVLSAVVVTCFVGCNLFKEIKLDEAKATLENEGYTVTEVPVKEYVDSEANEFNITEAELERYMYAVKGNDVVYLFQFVTIDTAEFNYGFMNKDGMLGGQSNNVVYLATKQGQKDLYK